MRYFWMGLVSFISGIITVYHFGFTIQAIFALFLIGACIALSIIDFKYQILPDEITLPTLWLGLFANSFSLFTAPQSAILGAIMGYLSLWSIYWIYKLCTQKEGMGYGDFKLLALLGAWLGWEALPFIIFFASLLGVIVGFTLILFKKQKYSTPMPFGPYLIIAGLSILFFKNNLFLFFMLTTSPQS